MSYRGSFTSEYIYDYNLYKTLRSEFEKRDCIEFRVFPAHVIGDYEIPIICGKIADTMPGAEYVQLLARLRKISINKRVQFVTVSELGDVHMINVDEEDITISRCIPDPDWYDHWS